MTQRKIFRLNMRRGTLVLGRSTLVMGVLNVTPDSFSDGGQFLGTAAAVAQALQLVADGADILDIGGESTRPYAEPVPFEQLLRSDPPARCRIRCCRSA